MSKITETLRHQLHNITIVVPHQIHVRLVGNVFHVSTCSKPYKDKWSSCLTTNRDIKAYAGYERGSCVLGGLQWVPRATWARHLDSSWGPHWMCEEDLENKKFDVSLLLSCMKTCLYIRIHRDPNLDVTHCNYSRYRSRDSRWPRYKSASAVSRPSSYHPS
ncbi:hypothetical protein SNOG_15944 [Parastagonospora nodorum SN15]|uniref:Uncharacterized protein n=1 Tax=Phaeosphaeria nodorum (strain SN15 / ATCC MYA-4574 / FGSC 10173) TaxID=321614 RepID=Q0TXD4_PHANO|nr:hypothetical protein SNOG_15944 [Parastagonospora nodorum SN15]EAT76782.1 hypothetical protein SNOG_15944 [Parastagonospora nodorum SN15]